MCCVSASRVGGSRLTAVRSGRGTVGGAGPASGAVVGGVLRVRGCGSVVRGRQQERGLRCRGCEVAAQVDEDRTQRLATEVVRGVQLDVDGPTRDVRARRHRTEVLRRHRQGEAVVSVRSLRERDHGCGDLREQCRPCGGDSGRGCGGDGRRGRSTADGRGRDGRVTGGCRGRGGGSGCRDRGRRGRRGVRGECGRHRVRLLCSCVSGRYGVARCSCDDGDPADRTTADADAGGRRGGAGQGRLRRAEHARRRGPGGLRRSSGRGIEGGSRRRREREASRRLGDRGLGGGSLDGAGRCGRSRDSGRCSDRTGGCGGLRCHDRDRSLGGIRRIGTLWGRYRRGGHLACGVADHRGLRRRQGRRARAPRPDSPACGTRPLSTRPPAAVASSSPG